MEVDERIICIEYLNLVEVEVIKRKYNLSNKKFYRILDSHGVKRIKDYQKQEKSLG